MTRTPPRFLLDADAFIQLHALRGLSCLRSIVGLRLTLTENLARHELNKLQGAVQELETCGVLRIEPVGSRDPNFKRLIKEGADKGEAESIAWALRQTGGEHLLFVSNDVKARKKAKENGLDAGDLLDFMLALVGSGMLAESVVRALLAPWEDRRQWRPKDFTTFDETVARRHAKKNP